jgi:hypothetical protein
MAVNPNQTAREISNGIRDGTAINRELGWRQWLQSDNEKIQFDEETIQFE